MPQTPRRRKVLNNKLDDPKDKCDVMSKLLEIYWQNFDKRRSYEWKLSLAIWTALAAFIALSIDPERGKAAMRDEMKVPLLIGALFIVAIQCLFLCRVRLASACDQKKALFYENSINEMLDVGFPPKWATASDVKKAIEKATTWHSFRGWWGLPVHVGITLSLIALAWYILFFTSSQQASCPG